MEELLHVIVLLPFLLALLIPALSRRLGARLGWAVLPLPFSIALYLLTLLPDIATGRTLAVSWAWAPSLGLSFTLVLDGFSLLFALLIAGIGTLVTFYSIFYLDPKEDWGRFYTYILLFLGAMLGVVLSDNLLTLYMFWEITSVSSFLLIGFWHREPESRAGALKSMLVTVAGGLSLLAGIVLLGVAGGTFSIRELLQAFGGPGAPGAALAGAGLGDSEFAGQALVGQAGALQAHPYYPAIVLLVLLGAFTKSAQAPFHLWLPGAMAAPTPVSAYLHSATMVKAGIFLTAKMGMLLGGTGLWFALVAGVGMITMVLGSYLAVQQKDLKGLLAFSTVSQLGFMMTMFGFGTAGALAAGVFHLLNHALFKGSLFMLVGVVDHQTGTREIDRLSGLARKMPVTALLMAVAALSMAGLPPLNGFVSKEMILGALLEPPAGAGPLAGILPVLAVAGSILTTFYSLILAHKIFFGRLSDRTPEEPEEASWGLLFPPALLVLLVVLLGVRPGLVEQAIVSSGVGALTGAPADVHLSLWHGLNLPLAMSLGAILLGGLLYLRREAVVAALRKLSDTRFNVNTVYEGVLRLLEQGSARLTGRIMTGQLRDYFVFILGFTTLIIAVAMIRSGFFRFDWLNGQLTPITWTELAVIASMVAGALTAVFARQRIAITLGVATTGFMVAVLWVLWHAPDLALTQTVVETVSVIPLFLAFAYMPRLWKRPQTVRVSKINAAVSIALGAVVAGYILMAQGRQFYPSIGQFFVDNSLTLGGGRNVVNVMLVDFRAADTMGEITVLGLVALAISTLVRSKKGVEAELPPGPVEKSAVMINPLILPAFSRPLVILVSIYAIYIFLRGHHNPGGGFVSALMAASAWIIWALAFERPAALALFPVKARYFIASGLLVVVSLGAGAVLVGYPFLTQAFVELEIPLLGHVELATAMIFDLGVWLVVFGAMKEIVVSMSGDRPIAHESAVSTEQAGSSSGI